MTGPDIVRQAKIVAARHCASISGLLVGILPEDPNAGQTMSGVRAGIPSPENQVPANHD
jgi:hypothetical protein